VTIFCPDGDPKLEESSIQPLFLGLKFYRNLTIAWANQKTRWIDNQPVSLKIICIFFDVGIAYSILRSGL